MATYTYVGGPLDGRRFWAGNSRPCKWRTEAGTPSFNGFSGWPRPYEADHATHTYVYDRERTFWRMSTRNKQRMSEAQ